MTVVSRLPQPFFSFVLALLAGAFAAYAGAFDAKDMNADSNQAATASVATQGSAKAMAVAKPMQLDMAFHPVIWDDNYKLGLGLSGGTRYFLSGATEIGGQALFTYYRKRIGEFEPVAEWGMQVFALKGLSLESPFLLKLGGILGVHRLEAGHWYASVGGVGEAAFSFVSPWGLYLRFSPGYLIGKNSQGVFRLGIGTTYNIGGKNAREPKAKLQPAHAETEFQPPSIFESTMVKLPDPELEQTKGDGKSDFDATLDFTPTPGNGGSD